MKTFIQTLAVCLFFAYSSALSVRQAIQNVHIEGKVPAEYLVTVRPDAAKNPNLQMADIVKKIEAHSSKLKIHDIHTFGKMSILVIHSEDEMDVANLGSIQEVVSMESDVNKNVLDCEEQSVLGILGLWNLARINLPIPTNDLTYRYRKGDGEDTSVYVVDTGVRVTHKDFEGRASHGYTVPNLRDNEGDDDLHGHGTHCAGTVAGKTYGAAKSAGIINVKVIDRFGYGPVSGAIAGLEWIYDDYVKKGQEAGSPYRAVVSMSLGWPRSGALDEAVAELACAGILLVASAGNSNTDACSQSPSGASASLGVAASDSTDRLASFSNYGTCADIIAPGTNILSAGIGNNDDTDVMSGTSMSTPLVAGVLLRYMSQAGYKSPSDLRQWVQQYSVKDVINLRGVSNTHNYLLFAPCDLL